MVEQERKRAKIGTALVFGLVAIAGCSTAVTSGTGGDGAGAAEAPIVDTADDTAGEDTAGSDPTTSEAPTTTAAPTTTLGKQCNKWARYL